MMAVFAVGSRCPLPLVTPGFMLAILPIGIMVGLSTVL
jgi:hypothetical protein